jgi:hypothetical protein
MKSGGYLGAERGQRGRREVEKTKVTVLTSICDVPKPEVLYVIGKPISFDSAL